MNKSAARMASEILAIETLLMVNPSPIMTAYSIARKTGISYRRVHAAINAITTIQSHNPKCWPIIGCHGSNYQFYMWSCVRCKAIVTFAD